MLDAACCQKKIARNVKLFASKVAKCKVCNLTSVKNERMYWQARSMDLNPLEYAWVILQRRLAEARIPQPSTRIELVNGLVQEWTLISLATPNPDTYQELSDPYSDIDHD
jgi:hypothetical protein